MTRFTVGTTPVQIDPGTASSLLIVNNSTTGTVLVGPGGHPLRPGRSAAVLRDSGVATFAVTESDTVTIDVTVTGTYPGATAVPAANPSYPSENLIGTAAQWAAHDLVLDRGQEGIQTGTPGTELVKIGDGVTRFSQLPSAGGGGAAYLTQAAAAAAYLTQSAATSTYAPLRKAQTLGYLGDSLVPASTFVDGGDSSTTYAWASMLRRLLGLRYGHGVLAGIGGQTSTQIAARVSTITASPPTWCIVHMGVNDIAAGAGVSATVIANITTTVAALRAAGIRPIVLTLIPSVNVNTTAKLDDARRVNDFILGLPQTMGVASVDWRSAVADWTSTTGAWVAGWTQDGVHPNGIGSVVLAKYLAQQLATILDLGVAGLVADAGANSSVLSLNPGMTGSGGTAGTGASGTIPASWSINGGVTGTVVSSVTARTDGVGGNWMTLAASAAGINVWQQNTAVGTAWNIGDTVWAECEIYVPSAVTNWIGTSLSLQFWNGIGSVVDNSLMLPPTMAVPWVGSTTPIVLKTLPTVVPASTGRLQVFLSFSPVSGQSISGTFNVGRYTIRKAI